MNAFNLENSALLEIYDDNFIHSLLEVTKGQIKGDPISRFVSNWILYMCTKFHAFIAKCTIPTFFDAMPLHYLA